MAEGDVGKGGHLKRGDGKENAEKRGKLENGYVKKEGRWKRGTLAKGDVEKMGRW